MMQDELTLQAVAWSIL